MTDGGWSYTTSWDATIRTVHAESDASYGMPRVRAELAEQGVVASAKRVARLMRAAGLRGVCRRRGFTVTTRREPRARPAPDLVDRDFTADGPDRLWVADMTYVPTWAGFVYLAECELIERRTWRTKGEAKLALFRWIEGWYNVRRRHSGLGQLAPAVYEERRAQALLSAAEPEVV